LDDGQVVGVGRERSMDQLVGGEPGREVERGCVDVVDPQLDRAPQHSDRGVAITALAEVEGGGAGEPHGAKAEAVDGSVTERPVPHTEASRRVAEVMREPFTAALLPPRTLPEPPVPVG
jgi:hypothetical protein